MSNVSFVVGAVGTLAGILGLLTTAHIAATRLLGGARFSVRATAAATLATGLYGLVFYALLGLGAFEPMGLVLGISIAACGVWVGSERLLSCDRPATGILRRDGQIVADSIRWVYSGWRLWMTGPLSLLVGANLVRAMVIPPLAWDSLTYHLVRAALWIRDAGISDYNAPGSWQDYQSLMPLGDALSAGVMILPASDALVPLLWFGVWCFLGLTVYAAARGLGAGRAGAWLGATAVLFVPSVGGGMLVAYVDNLVGALAVATFALLLSEEGPEQVAPTVLAMVGVGAALAVKKTALPFVGAGVAALAVRVIRNPEHRARRLFLGSVGFLILAGPPMAYFWIVEGSPLHPWGIDPSGLVSRVRGLLGAAATSLQGAGSAGGATGESQWVWLKYLLFKGYGNTFTLSHLGYGPGGPLIAIMGLAGLGLSVNRNEWTHNAFTIFAFLLAALAAVAAVVQYPNLDPNLARYSVGAIGLAGAGAACFDSRLVRSVLVALIFGHAIYMAPVNWGPSDTEATLYWLLLSVPFWLIFGLIAFWSRDQGGLRRLVAAGTAILILVVGTAATLEPVRQQFRYDIYTEATRGFSYSNHPLVGADSYESSKLWAFLDEQHGVTTAVTVGWALGGLNWFVYPFFGSRIQNDVTYVPVTSDGSLMPLEEKRRRAGDGSYEAWRKRLEERGVDFVAALAPRPIEVTAMETHSNVFELVAQGPNPQNRLYRVLHDQR